MIQPNNGGKCSACGGSIATDYQHGIVYCEDCGLIFEESMVDLGREWRAYDDEKRYRRVRTGPAMSYRIHDKGLSTPCCKSITQKRAPNQTFEHRDFSLVLGLSELDRMSSLLKLPNQIKEDSALLYRKVRQQNLIKCRSIEAVAGAVLYIICRQAGIPRTLKEVATVSRVRSKLVRRAYLFLVKSMALSVPVPDPECYINRFCSQLNLSHEIAADAVKIAKELKVVGERRMLNPLGLTATAIFVAARRNGTWISQHIVASVVGVTDVTIRNNTRLLVPPNRKVKRRDG